MGSIGSKLIPGRKSALTLKGCTLWKANRSPACRAVLMTIDAMNFNITEVDVNFDKCEHKSTEITMMNPFQTLPVFRDRELILYESHAICAYLASRYCVSGSCSRLYPTDPGGRAVVNQQMFYNRGVLYPRYRSAADPLMYQDCNFVMPQQICDVECAYAELEQLLGKRCWFGGSWPTLGDITIGSTVSSLNYIIPIDHLRYPVLSAWLSRLSEQCFYMTGNSQGLCEFMERIGELTPLHQQKI